MRLSGLRGLATKDDHAEKHCQGSHEPDHVGEKLDLRAIEGPTGVRNVAIEQYTQSWLSLVKAGA